jgi:di/tricarboxylate transporter
MLNPKQIISLSLIIIAIVLFTLSYNAYITGYHKAVSNVSNSTALFAGIFRSILFLITGAIFCNRNIFNSKWAK